jgi:hypothetical protein
MPQYMQMHRRTGRRLALAEVCFVLGLPLCALAGCDGQAPRGESVVVMDSLGVPLVLNHSPQVSEISKPLGEEPLIILGTVDGADGHDLFRVTGARLLADGGVAVMNSSTAEVRIFSREQVHTHSIGGFGEGPGEFRHASTMEVLPGDTVLIAESRGHSSSRFLKDGTLLETTRLPDGVISSFHEGFLLLRDGGQFVRSFEPSAIDQTSAELQRGMYHMVRIAPGGASADTIGTWPGADVLYLNAPGQVNQIGGRAVVVRPVFTPRTVVAGNAVANRVVIGDQREPYLQVLDGSGSLLHHVRWFPQEREPSTGEIAVLQEEQLAADEHIRARQRAAMARFPEGTRVPAFRLLAMGSDRTLWVERHPLPEDDEHIWWVFDEEGRWISAVELPPAAEVFDVGADYLITRERDALDVERISLWNLDRDRD